MAPYIDLYFSQLDGEELDADATANPKASLAGGTLRLWHSLALRASRTDPTICRRSPGENPAPSLNNHRLPLRPCARGVM